MINVDDILKQVQSGGIDIAEARRLLEARLEQGGAADAAQAHSRAAAPRSGGGAAAEDAAGALAGEVAAAASRQDAANGTADVALAAEGGMTASPQDAAAQAAARALAAEVATSASRQDAANGTADVALTAEGGTTASPQDAAAQAAARALVAEGGMDASRQNATTQTAVGANAVPRERVDDTLGYAQLDIDRASRTGFPEVIFGEGKTAEQIAAIFERLMQHGDRVLATRVSADKAELALQRVPAAAYHAAARALTWIRPGAPDTPGDGYIAVVCAGTSDVPVAEEAAVTAESMGCRVERVFDVGVAGIHRLFRRLPLIRGASVIVVAAGMEGALASVLGGLVSVPVIAVPTSIGYGASFQGVAALLSMLNACAPGISVVNIDNGFGAGYNAALIYKQLSAAAQPR